MDIKTIEKEFKEKVCKEIEISQEGLNRYVISTPFTFEDGDEFVIVLTKVRNDWVLTDDGHTFMHLSYFLDVDDLTEGNRKEIIDSTLNMFSVKNENGKLILPVPNSEYGDALFTFIEALVKISDVTYLSREIVKSTFFEDFKHLITESIPPEKVKFDWHDERRDPQKHYIVDCKIETKKERPLFVFAINNDKRANVVTVILQHYKLLNVDFSSLGIFENWEEISDKKALARLADVIDKQYSKIEGNEEDITKYLNRAIKN